MARTSRMKAIAGIVVGLLTLRALRNRMAKRREKIAEEEIETAAEHAEAAVEHARSAASKAAESTRERTKP